MAPKPEQQVHAPRAPALFLMSFMRRNMKVLKQKVLALPHSSHSTGGKPEVPARRHDRALQTCRWNAGPTLSLCVSNVASGPRGALATPRGPASGHPTTTQRSTASPTGGNQSSAPSVASRSCMDPAPHGPQGQDRRPRKWRSQAGHRPESPVRGQRPAGSLRMVGTCGRAP